MDKAIQLAIALLQEAGYQVLPPPVVPPHSDRHVSTIGLPEGVKNVLLSEGITTVGELTSKREIELLCLPNFGRKSLHKTKTALEALGLHLRQLCDRA